MEVSFYGKLPKYADYRSVRAENDSQICQEFRNWLNSAIVTMSTQLGANFGAVYDALPQMKYLICTGEPRTVFGCLIMASRDSSIHRRFPFYVAAASDYKARSGGSAMAAANHALFFRVAERLFEDAETAFDYGNQDNSLWKLREGLLRSSLGATERCNDYLASTTIEMFASRLKVNSRSSLQSVIQTVVESLLTPPIVVLHKTQSVFRFPLSGIEDTSEYEIAFWVLLLESVLSQALDDFALCWNRHRLDIACNFNDQKLLLRTWPTMTEHDELWDFEDMARTDGLTPVGKLDPKLFESKSSLRKLIDKAARLKDG